jgi:hypothetical protein
MSTPIIPDWEIVAQILRHVRQKVKVIINDELWKSCSRSPELFLGILPGYRIPWVPDRQYDDPKRVL